MTSWTMQEARTVAAATRTLERLTDARADASRILSAVLTPDAAKACDGRWWGLRLSQASILVDAWGDDEVNRAVRLRYAGHEAWDAAVCLPGMASLGLVCTTRQLAVRDTSTMEDSLPWAKLVVSGLTGCLDHDLEDNVDDSSPFFFDDWRVLAPWLIDTTAFFKIVQGRAVSSDLWWLGTNSLGLIDDEAARVDKEVTRRGSQSYSTASACSGVWDAGPDHACHLLETAQVQKPGDETEANAKPRSGLAVTRIFGVGPMKAGSTVVFQALGAATQLSLGLDCDAMGVVRLASRAARREVPLESVVDVCFKELFSMELAKDPLATPVARRLASAWPSLSSHGGPLRLYFVARNPFDCVRSLVEHLGLRTRVSSMAEQRFRVDEGHLPRHFTAGKQQYLDITREGLAYTGYIDAVAQRWALTVDEYLACPTKFVLVRYEDFVAAPVEQTKLLLEQLGLPDLWLPGAAERVVAATAVRYQTQGQRKGKSPAEVFGDPMLSRLVEALNPRMERFGYQFSTDVPRYSSREWRPIDVPALPQLKC